jgi:hypothetical protein
LDCKAGLTSPSYVDLTKREEMSSTLYFAAAGVLIFAACLSAGRKVHRHLMKPKLLGTITLITVLTLLLIWLLLITFGRKEGQPPRQPPDYSATSGNG